MPQWNWEIAYKKWFFVRFFLLLVALGLAVALAYITFDTQKDAPVAVESQRVFSSATSSQENAFDGSWSFISNEGTPYESSFGLDLKQQNDKLSGSYCAVGQGGAKSDCGDPNDTTSVTGTIIGNTATVKLYDDYAKLVLNAKILLKQGKLEWRLINPPQAEYYVPDNATLVKDKNAN